MAGSFDAGLVPLYTVQYSTNLELMLQQMGSRLRGRCSEGFHVGKMASPVNMIGPVAAKAPAGRFAPLNRTDANFVRRWVTPQELELEFLIDEFDEMQTIVDPKSQYVSSAANAIARGWDDAVIAAAPGSATIGTDPGSLSTETFNTANFQIAAAFGAGATATGMNIAKLLEARRIFAHYEVDIDAEPPCLVIGSKQESDMLSLTQVVSTEFNATPVLENGRLKHFLGFDIVRSERLPYSVGGTANTRGVLAFVKSGMYLGIWRDLLTDISQRKDLSGLPWQIYQHSMYGATRLEQGKVIQVLCYDTTGASVTP